VFISFRVLVSFERETLFGLYILYVFVKVFACSGFLRCLKETFFGFVHFGVFVKLFVCFRVLVLFERKTLFGFVHFVRACEGVLMF
jgi:hypothetical protein